MHRLDSKLVDKIAKTCTDLYKTLPKTGKPVDKEWTVLACIIKIDNISNEIEIVSLGTGSKCIGASKMSSAGILLNDSHAEVIARRGLILYLYENVEKAFRNESSIFHQGHKLTLKENTDFIFYSSQLPCGDASIIPKCNDDDNYGDLINNKRQTIADDYGVECKRARFEDIHRTGAKCLPNSDQDLKVKGKNYHLLGQVRTKPGRGDRTLSVSCSDKMARWIQLGIQGSLISMLCEPIYIKHFIFGSNVPFSEESLNRALLKRDSELCLKLPVFPQFYQSSEPFEVIRTLDDARPSPTSILWVQLDKQLIEVAVQGKKLGITKKFENTPRSSLSISKYNMYKRFLSILAKNEDIKQNIVGNEDIGNIPYNVMKRKSEEYVKEWMMVKKDFFKNWTVKPDIFNFCIKL